MSTRHGRNADKAAAQLGNFQFAVLKVLWNRGPSSIREARCDLERPAAYTTVATVLRRLERRGLVTHKANGQRYVYRAAVGPDEVTET